MTAAAAKLAAHGFTIEQARAYVFAHLDDAHSIFDAAAAIGLTTSMLAEIGDVAPSTVQQYFGGHGLDWTRLDPARTDWAFLTDLNEGDVFLYNAVTGQGRKIHSFDRSITDIAVDPDGNIFVTDFRKIVKFDVASGQLQTLATHDAFLNSLTIADGVLLGASATNNTLYAWDPDSGALLASAPVFGGAAAGDIAAVGSTLYKVSEQQGIVTVQGQGGSVLAPGVASNYWGLVQTPAGDLRAFAADRKVVEVDTATGAVAPMAPVSLVGLNTISGASDALDVHLAMFL